MAGKASVALVFSVRVDFADKTMNKKSDGTSFYPKLQRARSGPFSILVISILKNMSPSGSWHPLRLRQLPRSQSLPRKICVSLSSLLKPFPSHLRIVPERNFLHDQIIIWCQTLELLSSLCLEVNYSDTESRDSLDRSVFTRKSLSSVPILALSLRR